MNRISIKFSVLSHDFASLATRLVASAGLAAYIPRVIKRGQTMCSLQTARGPAWFQRGLHEFLPDKSLNKTSGNLITKKI
jgi:hypothetical protein